MIAQVFALHLSRQSAKFFLLLLLPLLLNEANADNLYRWTNSQGDVVYGDQPPSDAQDVQTIQSDDCQDDACEQEREQLRLEAEQQQQELEKSLQQIDQQRAEEQKQQAEIEKAKASRPVAPPGHTIIIAPDGWADPYIDVYDPRKGRWYRSQPYQHPARRSR